MSDHRPRAFRDPPRPSPALPDLSPALPDLLWPSPTPSGPPPGTGGARVLVGHRPRAGHARRRLDPSRPEPLTRGSAPIPARRPCPVPSAPLHSRHRVRVCVCCRPRGGGRGDGGAADRGALRAPPPRPLRAPLHRTRPGAPPPSSRAVSLTCSHLLSRCSTFSHRLSPPLTASHRLSPSRSPSLTLFSPSLPFSPLLFSPPAPSRSCTSRRAARARWWSTAPR